MALINTGAELFVFDNGAGYTGYNYVNVDNPNQTIGLTDEATSAIGAIVNGDYIPVTAMEIVGETLTALSGYKIAGETLSAQYATSSFSAEFSNSAGSADYATSAKYDAAGNIINQYYVDYDYLTRELLKKQNNITYNYVEVGPYSGQISGIGNSAIYSPNGGGGGGITYSAGDNILIDNGTISVTGVQLPMKAGDNIEITNDYINVTGVATINDVTGKQDKLTNAQLSAISSVSSMYNMLTAMSAMLSAQWKLSAGNGISITNNEATKTSIIGVV